MPTAVLAFLLPVLLTGPASGAPGAEPCHAGIHHVELPATATQEPARVCISPGQTTLINFDGALVPGALTLDSENRFTQVEPGPSSLKLVPSEKLTAGERLRLTVRFKDIAAPESATLLLVVHPAQAEPLVDVHRQTRPVESFRQELRALTEQVRQLQEENLRLRAEKAGPGGLSGLHALGLLDVDGFRARGSSASAKAAPASALGLAGTVWSFRAAGRVAVTLLLENPAGAAPWTAQGARLVLEGRRGVELKVVEVWPREPILPGAVGSMVVEVEAPHVDERGPFTLKVWEAEGGRTATIHGVMLP